MRGALWAMRTPVHHKANTQGFDIMGLMHHREREREKKRWFTASKHLPAQPRSVFRPPFSPDVVTLSLQRGSMWFLGVTQPILRRAGAQYGQSGLCAASPPSWMLLLASGCTASDATSSSHLHIHLISGSQHRSSRPVPAQNNNLNVHVLFFYCLGRWGESFFQEGNTENQYFNLCL